MFHRAAHPPQSLEGVLRRVPEEGICLTTLRGAAERGHVGVPADLPPSTWGTGKDYRVSSTATGGRPGTPAWTNSLARRSSPWPATGPQPREATNSCEDTGWENIG